MIMSKKMLSIILVVSGILVVGLAIILAANRFKKEEKIVSPTTGEIPGTQMPVDKGKFKTYNDEAGFSFNYSEDLTVKEVENQDETTYSWLEISGLAKPKEFISIKLTDTTLSSVDDWLKKNKQTDWVANEAVLSGMNGKIINSPTKIISVAIQKRILFLIESPADADGFWEKQHEIIGESFKVAWPTPKPATAPAGDSSGIEEIIE